MMDESVVVAMGGVRVRISAPAELIGAVRQRWAAFLAAPPAGWWLQVSWEGRQAYPAADPPPLQWADHVARLEAPPLSACFDTRRCQARLQLRAAHPWPELEYSLRLLVALAAFRQGGLLFHGAGVAVDGRGVVLFGPSGIGKTTAARHARGPVLNDDLVLLMPATVGWQVCATPFTNPTQTQPRAGDLPLAALCRLEQSEQVALRPLSRAEALAAVLACVPVLTAHPPLVVPLFDRCTALLQAVPAYVLSLRPDDTYWDVLREVV